MDEKSRKPKDQASSEPEQNLAVASSRRRKISKEQLKGILERHRQYLDSHGKQGEMADLEEAELQGAKLQSVNLQGANLEEADLQGADFTEANLQGANLSYANLKMADLEEANLQGSNLHHANVQGADLARANLQGADLMHTDMRGADLGRTNLQGADLAYANLQGTDLRRANLQGADLERANLQGADLEKANLRRAELKSATLEAGVVKKEGEPDVMLPPANLNYADLRNADLSDAKLSDVTGLLSGRLAGANLSNTKVPKEIAKFEGLKHIEKTSENARKIFFGLLLGCVYSWLTIATTTDARLLTNTASSPLPIIQTEIPIAWFYWSAPLILLSVYFYFHLYLLRLWQGLASLPAFFPDGKALDERAYPWLLNGLVRGHVPLLKENRPTLSRLQNSVSIILAWFFVPLTLVGFWLRYLPRQDWPGTILLISYTVTAAGFGLLTHVLARRALRGLEVKFTWKTTWRDGRSYVLVATLLVAVVVSLFSFGAINGEGWSPTMSRSSEEFAGPRTWLPVACKRLGCSPYPFADLREATLSSRPADWWKVDEAARQKLEGITGANLRGRSLRFAEALGAFLAKADLRGADLRGAHLELANLREADLRGANLRGANLEYSDLRKANPQYSGSPFNDPQFTETAPYIFDRTDFRTALLGRADLREASFVAADFQGASLYGSDLQGADIEHADFREAILREANLQGAQLGRAKIHGADLRATKGLSQAQLDAACGDENTMLPEFLMIMYCLEEKE